ncbi:DMT family transporter [Roseixanthobacter liquoris]|uniref:DMT family transporter n=1 Tax=Roseixanthobacter liquoris TaxID=3119921 RepID=UPI00372723B8
MTGVDAAPARARTPMFGISAVTASAACWGLATVLSKDVLHTMAPFTMLALQLAGSVGFLAMAFLLRGGRLPGGGRALSVAWPGLLEPGLAYGVSVPGLALTSATNATVLNTAEPVLICLLAFVLLGVRTSAWVLGCSAFAMVGVLLVTLSGDAGGGEGAAGDLRGDALVFLGTAFAALYVVASSRMVAGLPTLTLALLQQTVGLLFALGLLAVALATGWERWEAPPLGAVLVAVLTGVVQYAMAVWLYLTALRSLPAPVAGGFLALIPVFGVGGAVLLLGERLAPMQMLGGALVVAAMVAMAARRDPR